MCFFKLGFWFCHLFRRNPAFSNSANSIRNKLYASYRDEDDIEIDIDTPVPDPEINYDPVRARNLMNECEKHVNFARTTDVPEDWEAHILKFVNSSCIINHYKL